MCLGIPGRVVEIFNQRTSEEGPGSEEVLFGKVNFGGIQKQVCLQHVPDVKLGDYVIVHVGFAISKVDEVEAARVFDFLREMDELSTLEN